MTASSFIVGDRAPDFKLESSWDIEQKFYEKTGNGPAVLVFLRYIGCSVCQLALTISSAISI